MKRFFMLLGILLLSSMLVFAQAEEEEENNEDDVTKKERVYQDVKLNQKGDQFIKISLLGSIPLNFGDALKGSSQLKVGGQGTLGYHHFLNSYMAWGIDLGFGYQPTLGENIFNYIPLIGTFTFQPSIGIMEFPLTVGVGAAVENYLSKSYFPGLIVRCEAGMFWRINPSWSVGAEGAWMMMPQWYNNSEYNYIGHFVDVGLTVRYHF